MDINDYHNLQSCFGGCVITNQDLTPCVYYPRMNERYGLCTRFNFWINEMMRFYFMNQEIAV